MTLAHLAVVLPLRHRLGLNRVRLAISGAAPIAPEILAYFRALGIDVREGYGLTESTGLITINPADTRLGTVGTPFWGVEVSIAEDGEILSRSPGNFLGYHKDPEATADALAGGTFAVSVEPEGGSPTGLPTGPVVYSGKLIRE